MLGQAGEGGPLAATLAAAAPACAPLPTVADAEAAEGRPPLSEQEQLSRAILESAREAGRLHNEDADWDAAAGDEALAARLGREHDEHVAHRFASVDKAKAAPSSLSLIHI